MKAALPVAYDLCCGSGGWAEGLIAAGYAVVGYDVVPQPKYPGEFRLGDIRHIDSREMVGAQLIVASPPCGEFSPWLLPWMKDKRVEPDMSIVDACWRIRNEARPTVFILENVRAAQRWLGRATCTWGSFYLWGDVPKLPKARYRLKQSYSSTQRAQRAHIPFRLSYFIGIATRLVPRGLLEM